MEPTKEQWMSILATHQKQMTKLIDDYLEQDRADTAKFMARRTKLDTLIREAKDAIAAHPD
jgi:hypothetical protein